MTQGKRQKQAQTKFLGTIAKKQQQFNNFNMGARYDRPSKTTKGFFYDNIISRKMQSRNQKIHNLHIDTAFIRAIMGIERFERRNRPLKDNYTYPAIVEKDEEGFTNISFPSFDVMTCVQEGGDFIPAAQDLLALTIKDYEDNNRPVPPENIEFSPEQGQKLVYINLWMPYHRSTIKETYVKKTLTIPVWLNILANQSNINFSATLVSALKSTLGLSQTISDSEKQALYDANGISDTGKSSGQESF